ncbi:MAG: hypothetical protein JJE40_14785 [Vicinamibacteria bacterium]|nr:hypothetical protein [Vicinamibacteria bacterium]
MRRRRAWGRCDLGREVKRGAAALAQLLPEVLDVVGTAGVFVERRSPSASTPPA